MSLRVIFAGTPSIAAYIFEQLLVAKVVPVAVLTQPDRPAGRGKHLQPSPVKIVAERNNIAVLQPQNLNHLEIQGQLRAFNADVMIVIGYGLIVPQAVLDIPQYGCVNIHVSLLPRWRGAAPIQRAIQADDKQTGITIIQMNAGLDTGDILYQAICDIDAMETAKSLVQKLQILASESIIKVITDLNYYLQNKRQQAENGVTYAAKVSKSEAEIDWAQPAIKIQQLIRAFNPIPGAYSWFDDGRVKIFQAQVLDKRSKLSPGSIAYSSQSELHIATNDYDLAILELQLSGAKQLSCMDLMHSRANLFKQGKHFGSEK